MNVKQNPTTLEPTKCHKWKAGVAPRGGVIENVEAGGSQQ
jgi:hypothetical protein